MIVSRSRTMYPQSPSLTICGTVLKEPVDFDIFGVTFDSKMTFEKHLRSVSRTASQRLGILRKFWRVFHDRLLLGRRFRGFVLPVLEYCSAVWCSAADTHLKLLDQVVNGACFLAGGVLDCDLAHRRSVAVLRCCTRSDVNRCTHFMVLYRCHMCQSGLHVMLWRKNRYIYALPRCRTLQYCRTFVPLAVSLLNDLDDPVLDGVGFAGFKSRASAFYWPNCSPFVSSTVFYWLVLWSWGLRTDKVLIALPALHYRPF